MRRVAREYCSCYYRKGGRPVFAEVEVQLVRECMKEVMIYPGDVRGVRLWDGGIMWVQYMGTSQHTKRPGETMHI